MSENQQEPYDDEVFSESQGDDKEEPQEPEVITVQGGFRLPNMSFGNG